MEQRVSFVKKQEINKNYGLNKSTKDFNSTIELKFDTEVVDFWSGSVGRQAIGNEIILVLLKDGTVEYIPLYDAIKNNNVKSYGKIEGINGIVRLGGVSFSGNDGFGHNSPSFYDLFERLLKVFN